MDGNWISVDQVVLNDGINGAFRPDQIGNAQAAWASNLSITDGKPKTRAFSLVQRGILPKGRVQGAGFFSAQEGMFILSIWGQLWRVLVTGNNISVDPIPLDFVNSSIIRQVWMCETVGSFLVQDGQSDCIIYDGSVTRRADPLIPEVPRGTRMAFGNGRLAVALAGKQVKVGDIIRNIFQSELKFIETTYLSGGGSFLFKADVTGLAFLPVNNSDDGYGSLMVFGKTFANSLGLQVTSRELWDQMPGFEQVVLPKIGATGQDTIVAMNQDLYFRDVNGQIWSQRSAEYDAAGPGNAPLSREIARVVDFETDKLLPDSGGIFFNNRLLFLASPFYNRFGATSFKYLISLDASPLATIRGKSPPAYDGIVEGLNFVKLFMGAPGGVDRAFTISTDVDGENRLWELVNDGKYDSSFMSNGSTNVSVPVPIKSYYESRRFDWGVPGTLKQLMRLDIWPCELRGVTEITAYWRADNRSQWQNWGTIEVDAQMTNNPGQWVDLESQERGRVKSFTCPDGVDTIDQKRTDVGYGFQIRLVWTGYLLMDRIKLWGRPLPETKFSEIGDLDPGPLQNVVTNNGISYSIPVGGLGSSYTDQNGNVYEDQFAIPYTTAP